MRPEDRDAGALWDMHRYCLRVLAFSEGKTFDDYVDDEFFNTTVQHTLQIVGEAARRVSSEFRDAHPQIDWVSIISVRNRIVHQYEDVSAQIMWKIVTDDVPLLLSALEGLIHRDDDTNV